MNGKQIFDLLADQINVDGTGAMEQAAPDYTEIKVNATVNLELLAQNLKLAQREQEQ
jgi:hypothetical protein